MKITCKIREDVVEKITSYLDDCSDEYILKEILKKSIGTKPKKHIHVKVLCLRCSYEYDAVWGNFKTGKNRCPCLRSLTAITHKGEYGRRHTIGKRRKSKWLEYVRKALINEGCTLISYTYSYEPMVYEYNGSEYSLIWDYWQRGIRPHLANYKSKASNGERYIAKRLEDNGLCYEKEKTFEGLEVIKGFKLRFDFYLPNENICIEYDGKQHFEDNPNWKGIEYVKERDLAKDKYCEENNIRLIRISHSVPSERIDFIIEAITYCSFNNLGTVIKIGKEYKRLL